MFEKIFENAGLVAFFSGSAAFFAILGALPLVSGLSVVLIATNLFAGFMMWMSATLYLKDKECHDGLIDFYTSLVMAVFILSFLMPTLGFALANSISSFVYTSIPVSITNSCKRV